MSEDVAWKRRSETKLIQEGDKNTKISIVANHHQMCNYIEELEVVGNIVRGNEALRESLVIYFKDLYSDKDQLRLSLEELRFAGSVNRISYSLNNLFQRRNP